MLQKINDSLLIEIYNKACDLKIDNNFIELLKEEMRNRKIVDMDYRV